MQKSKIPWCTHTWNPCIGCSLPLVSSGCQQCYARKLHNGRHKAYKAGKNLPKQYAKPFEEVQLFSDRLIDPLRCRAKKARIFIGSMTDLFGEKVPFEFIDKIFDVIQRTPDHTYQILTKRPKRMADFIYQAYGVNHKLDNAWLGVSISNQAEADEKIPILLQMPAAVRWLSIEPMLGAIDLRCVIVGPRRRCVFDCLRGTAASESGTIKETVCGTINWVVCGGESGSGARPMHPDWPRGLRDQCVAAGVPFYFKQWGKFVAPNQTTYRGHHNGWRFPVGCSYMKYDGTYYPGYPSGGISAWTKIYGIGKKKAGCILDGKEWKQYPK